MHINSTAPQAPEQNKFKVGDFDVEHRITTQHPAGLYRISHRGQFVGSQYSQPNLDDCQRIRAQTARNRAEQQLATRTERHLPFGRAEVNARRAKRGGDNSKRSAAVERTLADLEEA